jgi:DNA topoisomerase-1
LEEKEKIRAARAKEAMVRQMGLDPENGWKAYYEIVHKKEKVLAELKKAADKVKDIYLATDLDREGEAIAWHLQEVIGGEKERYKRVVFPEITKKAIQDAFAQPGKINMDRVNAQQARRFLDRVVGFMLSPLLWKKIARGLSAGRVQSVAVRLIVEREKEIHAFIPEEYWEILACLETTGIVNGKEKSKFKAKVVKYQGNNFKPSNKLEAEKAKEDLEKVQYQVEKQDIKPVKKRPNAPFITSTLQQTASMRLGFKVKRTMMLAQRLYEAGYITYMRTDSTNLSKDALSACRGYISMYYGKQYLPDSPNFYKSKPTAQEAHEAIRPSNVNIKSKELSHLDADQVKLYDLIWRRFIASQMPPAEYDSKSILIKAGDYQLKASGSVMRFDGWMKVLPPLKKNGEDDIRLPDLTVGEILSLMSLELSQHFTKPPARYNEASLVKELEKRGIGRPSTYASIISTIQERGYVRLEKKRFYAEKMGDVVTEKLLKHFHDLMDYGFTAKMEEDLDIIAQGRLDWKKALDNYYHDFKQDLDLADEGMKEKNPTLTDISCPKCGRAMVIRIGRTGVFLACSGYNEPVKERCKGTINLVRGDEVENAVDDENGGVNALMARHRCPICGTAMDSYLIDEGRKLHICGNNPDCNGFEVEHGKFRLKGYNGPVITCDKCGADMELRTGRFGKFFGCTNYPECKNTRKLLKNGEPAPPKAEPVHMPELKCEKSDGYFILRDGAAGLFLASSSFPKSRETRSPFVEDIIRHKDELDPKYQYLADAPAVDPEGNKAIIRFKRKEKIHYIMSKKDGKETEWTAYYENGRWIEYHKKKSKYIKEVIKK